jgi:hypothetical protein
MRADTSAQITSPSASFRELGDACGFDAFSPNRISGCDSVAPASASSNATRALTACSSSPGRSRANIRSMTSVITPQA